MKKIILTGGGTAGHVTPNLALVPKLKELNYDILYIGSYNGMEKELVESLGISYKGISSGKLRRYFDLKNFTDPFRVIKGYFETKKIIKEYKPDIVFSKGGFVTVPVTYAAHRLKFPVIIHESDFTPGLANKISFKNADLICCNFPETLALLPKDKAKLTGTPIRNELFLEDKDRAIKMLNFEKNNLPVLLIIGGSLGSVRVNTAIRNILPRLLEKFNIIHLCGKGNLDNSLENKTNYKQFEYIKEELKDLFALADVVVSRAGANAIYELLALKKANLLIPLSAKASRGDQILNAKSFKKQGFSNVLEEENITDDSLYNSILDTYNNREIFIEKMSNSEQSNGLDLVIEAITKLSR